MVQFYPWFKFSFLLFQTHYHVIIIHHHTQKQKKRKFEPRIKLNQNRYRNTEGGIRVCGIAVLGYFWCGVAVIFISQYGIAVFRVQVVCGEFKFYVAVVGKKNVVSR